MMMDSNPLEFVKGSSNDNENTVIIPNTMTQISLKMKIDNNSKKRLKTNHLFEFNNIKQESRTNDKILVTEFTPGILNNLTQDKPLVIQTINSIPEENRNVPLLLASLPPEMKNIVDEDERFRYDVDRRAEDMDFKSDIYKTIPIHEYGAALLRGMGWTGPTEEDEKRMIEQSKPMMARVNRLGLGATPKPPEEKNKNKKSSEAINEEWKKKAEEKLKKQVFKTGDLVWIRNVKDLGKRAQVVAVTNIPGLDKIRIRFEKDGIISDISRTDVILLSDAEIAENPYDKKYYDLPYEMPAVTYSTDSDKNKPKIDDKSKNNSNNVAESKDQNESGNKKHVEKDSSQTKSKLKERSWLCHSIKVRIITKKLNSNYYLQKGNIVDVPSDGVASVRLDDGTLIESIKEKYLETVLPGINGQCKVLRGPYVGLIAILLEKRKSKDEAVIQLSDDLEIIVISMNDIAAII